MSSLQLSFLPRFHCFYALLWSLLPSFAFSLFYFLWSCAFLPVGIYVHVPDPNPGGLDRCHGPDSCGCRESVGPCGSHLLHPLPSVCYPGEGCSVLPQISQISCSIFSFITLCTHCNILLKRIFLCFDRYKPFGGHRCQKNAWISLLIHSISALSLYCLLKWHI